MKIKVGDKLENIKFRSISGEDFELGNTKGKKILLSFEAGHFVYETKV